MELQSTLGSVNQALKISFKGMPEEMQMCIQNCLQCSQICEQMIQHCLKKGGMHAEPNHIQLLQDCADICAVSAKFMMRESNLHTKTCGVCADACLACAQDCERMTDDEMMEMCAEVCRRCAESCQKMSVMQ